MGTTSRTFPPARLQPHHAAIACVVALGCTTPDNLNTWDAPSGEAGNLLFTPGDTAPPLVRSSGQVAGSPSTLTSDWQVDRRFTGTISAEGSQSRERLRATRQRNGYTETFTSTSGPQGSTFRRRFRANSRGTPR